MTREAQRRRTILRALAALARDEARELAKLRRLRTALYWAGAILVGSGFSIVQQGGPGWIAWLSGVLGGVTLGLGVHYDNSLNQWPTLCPCFDGERARRDAAALDGR